MSGNGIPASRVTVPSAAWARYGANGWGGRRMARRKEGDKPGALHRATVAEVVEVGSSAASVNAIARRAGVAVGTIYRYHDSKEALLRAAYLSVKADIHAAMMAAAAEGAAPRARIEGMWHALLNFVKAEPNAFLFAEVVMAGVGLDAAGRAEIEAMAAEARGVLQAAMAEGALRPGDPRAVAAVLAGPVMQIARAAALSGAPPDDAHVREVFALCWRAVATSATG